MSFLAIKIYRARLKYTFRPPEKVRSIGFFETAKVIKPRKVACFQILMTAEKVTLEDVYKAWNIVRRYLPKTPLISSPALSKRLGFDAYVKCDNTLPTGSFKVRGGINLISQLSDAEKRRGVIAASTGNHAQSVA